MSNPTSDHFKEPRINTRWINARGEVFDPGWPVRGNWLWVNTKKRKGDRPPVPHLVLRTTIDLPLSYKVLKWEGRNVAGAIRLANGKLVIDLQEETSTIALELESKATGRIESGLVVESDGSRNGIFLHPSCESSGIGIQNFDLKDTNYFLSAYCEQNGSDLKIQVEYSSQTRLDATSNQNEGSRLRQGQSGTGWTTFIVSLAPQRQPGGRKTPLLGRFASLDLKGSKLAEYFVTISSEPGGEGTRLPVQLGVGTGASYLRYRQNQLGIDLRESSLTAKIVLSYELLPEKIDLGLSGFGNLLVFSKVPASVPTSRFSGYNARLGYRLPTRWLDMSWKASFGWYFWSMYVSDDSYGASFLSGPQVFFSSAGETSGGRGFSVYCKYAPIIDQHGALSFRSGETAFGGTWQISGLRNSGRPWFVTLDASQATYKLDHDISLQTLSAGIQTTL